MGPAISSCPPSPRHTHGLWSRDARGAPSESTTVSRDRRSPCHGKVGPPRAMPQATWEIDAEPRIQPQGSGGLSDSPPHRTAGQRDLSPSEQVLGRERARPAAAGKAPIELVHEAEPFVGIDVRRESPGLGEGANPEIDPGILRDGAVVLAEEVERLPEVGKAMAVTHPEPELDVLDALEAWVITPGLEEGLATEHHRAVHQRAEAALELLDQSFVANIGRELAERSSMRIHEPSRGAEHRDLGMLVQEADLSREAIGERDVVGILSGDVLAPGHLDRAVQRRGDSLVLLSYNGDPWVLEAPRHVARTVRVPAVDEDELKIVEGLMQYTLDGGGEESAAVEDAHHNGDPRRATLRLRRPVSCRCSLVGRHCLRE